MSFHSYRITHYGKLPSGAYESTGTQLDEVLSINITFEIKDAADGCSFTIDNSNSSKFSSVKIDDRVVIEGTLDGTTYTTLIDSIIQDKQASGSVSQSLITFSGLNRLEKLFNAVANTGGGSSARTADAWIKDIIDQVNDFNVQGGAQRTINYSDSTIQSIPSTEATRFDRSYVRAFTLIEELSQPEYTGGKYMYYYLDSNNTFYWKERPTNISDTREYGVDLLSHRTVKDMSEVVNYVILNGGKSPNGSTILDFGYDVRSISKFGWKVKVVSEESISSGLKTKDRESKPPSWSDDSEYPTSYPYTTVWGDTVSSDGDYNSSFVDEAREIIATRISEFLQLRGGATSESDIELTPLLVENIGELNNIIIPEIGWNSGNPQGMRVEQINLSFGTNGWRTDLNVAEDNELGRVEN